MRADKNQWPLHFPSTMGRLRRVLFHSLRRFFTPSLPRLKESLAVTLVAAMILTAPGMTGLANAATGNSQSTPSGPAGSVPANATVGPAPTSQGAYQTIQAPPSQAANNTASQVLSQVAQGLGSLAQILGGRSSLGAAAAYLNGPGSSFYRNAEAAAQDQLLSEMSAQMNDVTGQLANHFLDEAISMGGDSVDLLKVGGVDFRSEMLDNFNWLDQMQSAGFSTEQRAGFEKLYGSLNASLGPQDSLAKIQSLNNGIVKLQTNEISRANGRFVQFEADRRMANLILNGDPSKGEPQGLNPEINDFQKQRANYEQKIADARWKCSQTNCDEFTLSKDIDNWQAQIEKIDKLLNGEGLADGLIKKRDQEQKRLEQILNDISQINKYRSSWNTDPHGADYAKVLGQAPDPNDKSNQPKLISIEQAVTETLDAMRSSGSKIAAPSGVSDDSSKKASAIWDDVYQMSKDLGKTPATPKNNTKYKVSDTRLLTQAPVVSQADYDTMRQRFFAYEKQKSELLAAEKEQSMIVDKASQNLEALEVGPYANGTARQNSNDLFAMQDHLKEMLANLKAQIDKDDAILKNLPSEKTKLSFDQQQSVAETIAGFLCKNSPNPACFSNQVQAVFMPYIPGTVDLNTMEGVPNHEFFSNIASGNLVPAAETLAVIDKLGGYDAWVAHELEIGDYSPDINAAVNRLFYDENGNFNSTYFNEALQRYVPTQVVGAVDSFNSVISQMNEQSNGVPEAFSAYQYASKQLGQMNQQLIALGPQPSLPMPQMPNLDNGSQSAGILSAGMDQVAAGYGFVSAGFNGAFAFLGAGPMLHKIEGFALSDWGRWFQDSETFGNGQRMMFAADSELAQNPIWNPVYNFFSGYGFSNSNTSVVDPSVQTPDHSWFLAKYKNADQDPYLAPLIDQVRNIALYGDPETTSADAIAARKASLDAAPGPQVSIVSPTGSIDMVNLQDWGTNTKIDPNNLPISKNISLDNLLPGITQDRLNQNWINDGGSSVGVIARGIGVATDEAISTALPMVPFMLATEGLGYVAAEDSVFSAEAKMAAKFGLWTNEGVGLGLQWHFVNNMATEVQNIIDDPTNLKSDVYNSAKLLGTVTGMSLAGWSSNNTAFDIFDGKVGRTISFWDAVKENAKSMGIDTLATVAGGEAFGADGRLAGFGVSTLSNKIVMHQDAWLQDYQNQVQKDITLQTEGGSTPEQIQVRQPGLLWFLGAKTPDLEKITEIANDPKGLDTVLTHMALSSNPNEVDQLSQMTRGETVTLDNGMRLDASGDVQRAANTALLNLQFDAQGRTNLTPEELWKLANGESITLTNGLTIYGDQIDPNRLAGAPKALLNPAVGGAPLTTPVVDLGTTRGDGIDPNLGQPTPSVPRGTPPSADSSGLAPEKGGTAVAVAEPPDSGLSTQRSAPSTEEVAGPQLSAPKELGTTIVQINATSPEGQAVRGELGVGSGGSGLAGVGGGFADAKARFERVVQQVLDKAGLGTTRSESTTSQAIQDNQGRNTLAGTTEGPGSSEFARANSPATSHTPEGTTGGGSSSDLTRVKLDQPIQEPSLEHSNGGGSDNSGGAKFKGLSSSKEVAASALEGFYRDAIKNPPIVGVRGEQWDSTESLARTIVEDNRLNLEVKNSLLRELFPESHTSDLPGLSSTELYSKYSSMAADASKAAAERLSAVQDRIAIFDARAQGEIQNLDVNSNGYVDLSNQMDAGRKAGLEVLSGIEEGLQRGDPIPQEDIEKAFQRADAIYKESAPSPDSVLKETARALEEDLGVSQPEPGAPSSEPAVETPADAAPAAAEDAAHIAEAPAEVAEVSVAKVESSLTETAKPEDQVSGKTIEEKLAAIDEVAEKLEPKGALKYQKGVDAQLMREAERQVLVEHAEEIAKTGRDVASNSELKARIQERYNELKSGEVKDSLSMREARQRIQQIKDSVSSSKDETASVAKSLKPIERLAPDAMARAAKGKALLAEARPGHVLWLSDRVLLEGRALYEKALDSNGRFDPQSPHAKAFTEFVERELTDTDIANKRNTKFTEEGFADVWKHYFGENNLAEAEKLLNGHFGGDYKTYLNGLQRRVDAVFNREGVVEAFRNLDHPSAEDLAKIQAAREQLQNEPDLQKRGLLADLFAERVFQEMSFEEKLVNGITKQTNWKLSGAQIATITLLLDRVSPGTEASGGKTEALALTQLIQRFITGADLFRGEILVPDELVSDFAGRATVQKLGRAFGATFEDVKVLQEAHKTAAINEIMHSGDAIGVLSETVREHLSNAATISSDPADRIALAQTWSVKQDEVHQGATGRDSGIMAGAENRGAEPGATKAPDIEYVAKIETLYHQLKSYLNARVFDPVFDTFTGDVISVNSHFERLAALKDLNARGEEGVVALGKELSFSDALLEKLDAKSYEQGEINSVANIIRSEQGERNGYKVGPDPDHPENTVIFPTAGNTRVQTTQISNDIAGQIAAAIKEGLDPMTAVRVQETKQSTDQGSIYENTEVERDGSSATVSRLEKLIQGRLGSRNVVNVSMSEQDLIKQVMQENRAKNQSAGGIIDRFDLRTEAGVRQLMDYVRDPANHVWDPATGNLQVMVESPQIARQIETYLKSIDGGNQFVETIDPNGNNGKGKSVGNLHILDDRLSDEAVKELIEKRATNFAKENEGKPLVGQVFIVFPDKFTGKNFQVGTVQLNLEFEKGAEQENVQRFLRAGRPGNASAEADGSTRWPVSRWIVPTYPEALADSLQFISETNIGDIRGIWEEAGQTGAKPLELLKSYDRFKELAAKRQLTPAEEAEFAQLKVKAYELNAYVKQDVLNNDAARFVIPEATRVRYLLQPLKDGYFEFTGWARDQIDAVQTQALNTRGNYVPLSEADYAIEGRDAFLSQSVRGVIKDSTAKFEDLAKRAANSSDPQAQKLRDWVAEQQANLKGLEETLAKYEKGELKAIDNKSLREAQTHEEFFGVLMEINKLVITGATAAQPKNLAVASAAEAAWQQVRNAVQEVQVQLDKESRSNSDQPVKVQDKDIVPSMTTTRKAYMALSQVDLSALPANHRQMVFADLMAAGSVKELQTRLAAFAIRVQTNNGIYTPVKLQTPVSANPSPSAWQSIKTAFSDAGAYVSAATGSAITQWKSTPDSLINNLTYVLQQPATNYRRRSLEQQAFNRLLGFAFDRKTTPVVLNSVSRALAVPGFVPERLKALQNIAFNAPLNKIESGDGYTVEYSWKDGHLNAVVKVSKDTSEAGMKLVALKALKANLPGTTVDVTLGKKMNVVDAVDMIKSLDPTFTVRTAQEQADRGLLANVPYSLRHPITYLKSQSKARQAEANRPVVQLEKAVTQIEHLTQMERLAGIPQFADHVKGQVQRLEQELHGTLSLVQMGARQVQEAADVGFVPGASSKGPVKTLIDELSRPGATTADARKAIENYLKETTLDAQGKMTWMGGERTGRIHAVVLSDKEIEPAAVAERIKNEFASGANADNVPLALVLPESVDYSTVQMLRSYVASLEGQEGFEMVNFRALEIMTAGDHHIYANELAKVAEAARKEALEDLVPKLASEEASAKVEAQPSPTLAETVEGAAADVVEPTRKITMPTNYAQHYWQIVATMAGVALVWAVQQFFGVHPGDVQQAIQPIAQAPAHAAHTVVMSANAFIFMGIRQLFNRKDEMSDAASALGEKIAETNA